MSHQIRLSPWMWLALAAAGICACGSSSSDECPSGTKPSVFELARTRTRECVRADGTRHGPAVEIDEHGRERRVGQWVDGEKVGVWRLYSKDVVISEATYVDGDLRLMVAFQADGRPLIRANYLDGVAHGAWARWNKDGLLIEREYTKGRRSGTWRRHGSEPETKVYDPTGTLVSVNGKPVPPPEAQIRLPDGTVLERAGCGLAAVEAYAVEPCHDLFEAFQICLLDADPSGLGACHERAFVDYRRPVRQ